MERRHVDGRGTVIPLPIEVGDVILTGKFRNHRVAVKDIGTDDKGQPTINGKSILKIRIAKLMQDIDKGESMQRLQNLINESAKNEEAGFDSLLHEIKSFGIMADKIAKVVGHTGKEPGGRDKQVLIDELETLLKKAKAL